MLQLIERAVFKLVGAKTLCRKIKRIFIRHKNSAHDGAAVFNQRNIDRKLAVALDELFGTVQRIHDPEAHPVLALPVRHIKAFLAEDGNITILKHIHNNFVGFLIGNSQWRRV